MPYRDLPTTKAAALCALDTAQRKTVATDPPLWLIAAAQYTAYLNPETPPEGSAGSILYRFRKEPW